MHTLFFFNYERGWRPLKWDTCEQSAKSTTKIYFRISNISTILHFNPLKSKTEKKTWSVPITSPLKNRHLSSKNSIYGGQPRGRGVKVTHSTSVAQRFAGSDPGCRHGTTHQAMLRRGPTCRNQRHSQLEYTTMCWGALGRRKKRPSVVPFASRKPDSYAVSGIMKGGSYCRQRIMNSQKAFSNSYLKVSDSWIQSRY